LSTVLAPMEGQAPLTRSGTSGRGLRVLQVISSIADVNGGASTAMWSTLDALRLCNVDVDLVTTNEDGLHRLMDVPFGKFIRQREHRIRYFPARGDRYTTSWPLAAWLLRHVREYDIVHVHGIFRFAPVVAAHAAIARGVPYVLTLHNTLGDWGMRHRRPLLKKLSIGLIEGRILDRARKVHLCSADELYNVSQVRPVGTRSAVFPLGIDFPQTAAAPPIGESGYESFAGRKVVLFMSRIHEIKGLDTLITAFASVQEVHPDAVLVIAGTGDEHLVDRLRALAQKVGVQQRTHWVGFVQGQRKLDLLAAATVFVLPSHSENFGYAVVEAMLAGLPVITTAKVPAGEFAIEAGAGVIFDGTAEDLALSINVMLALPAAQRGQLGARAESMVRQRLSLETYGHSLETLYREACQAS
jgi:glycosyltransferase involved in cell wall biosynthesis